MSIKPMTPEQMTPNREHQPTLTARIERRLAIIRSPLPPVSIAIVEPLPDPQWQIVVLRQNLPSRDIGTVDHYIRQAAATGASTKDYVILHNRIPIHEHAVTTGLLFATPMALADSEPLIALTAGLFGFMAFQTIAAIQQRRNCSLAAAELQECLQRVRAPDPPSDPEVNRINILPQAGIAFSIRPHTE